MSKSASATRGVAGWVKEDDLSLHTHVGVDKKDKTLYIKGNGIAYAKAWGGKKDLVYDTNKLSQYKGQAFKIHLTEKVGNNTWYRGMLDGKQVWLHSSYVESPQESKTSLLGHIISGDVDIYEKEINGKSIKAGSQYTNAVYYIKRQAKLDNDTYYLISKSPSDTKGVVGGVKESDLSIRTHVGVDKKSKTFYIKGNGKATTKAWGGKKDTVYGDLSGYINEPFKVHLTEKVGNNTWYRGTLGGKTVWLHSSYVYEATKSKTSLLGHIRSGKVQIYESIGGKSISAGSKYTNAVYYIKEEAKSGNDTYYLISKSPSATRGVVGWVKEDDLSLHTHVGVDKKDKTLYIKGNGIAYAKAWGGKKDLVYDTNKLSQYKGQAFKIHLTEKVGNNTWYRGMLDGKQVWLHSSYVEEPQGTKTSMLAHIVSGSVEIYETIGGKSFKAGATYTNAVYYIKLKRKVGNQEYYLISTSPSSVNGVVGWVKVEDLSYHDHVGVDKKAKTFYIKGNGKAYTKAWGGSKNLVYDLSNYKGELFNVHLTEKVGKNTWYRGKINGKTVWIHSGFLTKTYESYTDYNITLKKAVDIQMKLIKDYHPNTTRKELEYYLNINNFINDPVSRFQFLDLSKPSGASINILNNYLKGRGTLSGHGKTFYDASRKYKINDVYLISHSILETGHGKSNLASGIEVGKDKKGNLVLVNNKNRKDLTEIKKAYNMFGIQAFNSCPDECGAKYAYKKGWFSPKLAIEGGAQWISEDYINNKFKQNTLYKMRWNPDMGNGNGWKQYATDVAWAHKQVGRIYELYQEIGLTEAIAFDYPKYR